MQDEPTSPTPAAESEGTGPATPSGVTPQPPTQPPPDSRQPAAGRPNRVTSILGHRATGWFVAALLVGVVTGLAVALANTSSGPARAIVESPSNVLPPYTFTRPASPRGSLPIPVRPFGVGALTGRVQSTSTSSFTVATSFGANVKVEEQSSTIYRRDGSAATKASVKKGVEVFVVGTRSGSTVKASVVTIIAMGPQSSYLPG